MAPGVVRALVDAIHHPYGAEARGSKARASPRMVIHVMPLAQAAPCCA